MHNLTKKEHTTDIEDLISRKTNELVELLRQNNTQYFILTSSPTSKLDCGLCYDIGTDDKKIENFIIDLDCAISTMSGGSLGLDCSELPDSNKDEEL